MARKILVARQTALKEKVILGRFKVRCFLEYPKTLLQNGDCIWSRNMPVNDKWYITHGEESLYQVCCEIRCLLGYLTDMYQLGSF